MSGSGMRFGHKATASVDRGRALEHLMKLSGYFEVQVLRDKKVVHRERLRNGVTDTGITNLLDWGFRDQTQPTNWYLGIIDNSGYTGVAAGDTMASHSGWNEFTTYSETNRQEWVTVAAAAKAITNTTTTDFSITGAGTLKGIFAVSDNTKSGSTGVLWATALFSATVAVVNGDTLKITYTVSGS
jgi:hypothetical protein